MLDNVSAQADQHLQLMRRMQQRLEIAPRYDAGAATALRWARATRACAFCGAAAQCRRWLDEGHEPQGYRAFCANAELFDSQR
ncbi:MAG: DUF6455 family protein [Pseudomonadota bacterium]